MSLFLAIKSRFTTQRDIPTTLWRRGGLVAAFLLTILVGNKLIPKDKAVTWDMLGHDFLALYYGGNCALTGHYERLYDLPSTKAFEYSTGTAAGLALGNSFGPWWNPPFAAWLFAPFAALPYLSALHAWWCFSAICLSGAIFLLCRMLQGAWKVRLLVPLLILTSMPTFQAFCHGQNTFFSLLLLTTTVWFWRTDRPLLAGIVCGLLFYKPQLGAVIAAVLCLHQGRRALLGVCLTGTALVLVNVLTMPGTLHQFVYQMPLNLHWIQEEIPYRWERHVTLKAFWRLVFQGDAVGPTSIATRILWLISEAALFAGLVRVFLASIGKNKSPSQRDRLIAATIIAMPLLMPFYFDYDLLLMSVAIVVYAADRQNDPTSTFSTHWEDRWLFRVWSLVFLTLMLWKSIYNPTVPLLAAGAVLLIRRALRPHEIVAKAEQQPQTFRPSLAA
jgi:alpha-1,2-mannosyltransferase